MGLQMSKWMNTWIQQKQILGKVSLADDIKQMSSFSSSSADFLSSGLSYRSGCFGIISISNHPTAGTAFPLWILTCCQPYHPEDPGTLLTTKPSMSICVIVCMNE